MVSIDLFVEDTDSSCPQLYEGALPCCRRMVSSWGLTQGPRLAAQWLTKIARRYIILHPTYIAVELGQQQIQRMSQVCIKTCCLLALIMVEKAARMLAGHGL